MKVFLNTTPCQFSESKTKNAITYINYLETSRCIPNSENGVHHTTIIFTNNSLIEGRQWNIRLENENNFRKVAILSSDTQRAMFNSSDKFLGYCSCIDKPDDLIDVLVVCNNSKRGDDILKIIKTFNERRINLSTIGIVNYKFTIMYDEADVSSNLNIALEHINKLDSIDCIESIHLITATPYNKFWNKLKQIDLPQLKNLRYELSEVTSPKILIDDYRQIQEHNIIYNNVELNPVEYIKHTYTNFIEGNTTNALRIFAPPHKYIETHEEIKKFFLYKEFIVVIINGREKCIYFSSSEKISINDFNKKRISKEKDVEMYRTLTKLHSLYSNTNIVITGFNCVERGITFQTNGFNFTDMIIPPIKDVAIRVQVGGRANGGKEYVDKHNIYMQEEMFVEMKNKIKYAMDLIESPPELICETDFRETTEKEKDMVNWSVPQIISCNKEIFEDLIIKRGVKFDKYKILKWLKDNNVDLEGYAKIQWACSTDKSYKKNIIPLINAKVNNNKLCLFRKKDKHKGIKMYNLYFDHKNHNIIILKYM